MKKLINSIDVKILDKLMSLKTASVFTRVVSGILTSKAIAVFIGAEGLALIGNFRNFTSGVQAISILGLYNGVVRHVSNFKENLTRLSQLLSTVFYVGFITTIITSIACYLFAGTINDLIFPAFNDYTHVIKIFAVVLPFYALNMFSFSIMNGFSKYKILIIISIIGQVLGLSVALLLIYQNKIEGALISVAIAEALIFLITLVGILNRRSLMSLIQIKNISFHFVKRLSPYTLMILCSSIILPFVFIAIRTYIIEKISYKDAGFWEAMTRISKYYVLVIMSLMTYYVLPKFQGINTLKEFQRELIVVYKKAIPILLLGLAIIYFLRHIIVAIIFSYEFERVADLFFWQLTGDFFKVLSMVVVMQFIAKKMFWHYMVLEAFLVVILYATSIYFINVYGLKGVVMAHLASYAMYFGLIILILRSSVFGLENTIKDN